MAIVALESMRNRCLVIGEDLGTVPDEMRGGDGALRSLSLQRAVLREGTRWPIQVAQRYIRHALATVTTHDLPPLKSWWEGA